MKEVTYGERFGPYRVVNGTIPEWEEEWRQARRQWLYFIERMRRERLQLQGNNRHSVTGRHDVRHWVAFLVWGVDCLEQSERLEWLEKKHAMSKYANYTVASEDYDKTRAAVGVDTVLGCLARTGVLLGDQTVLEAGCGTGNYLEALRPHLGFLAGIDFSEGMLAQARTKLSEDVELTCGSILDMPYEDERFDGITCNQVIHHLEEGPGASDDPADWRQCSYPNVTQFIQEAYRVLRPGGAFVINATSHEQFRDGYWWADLIPVAVVRLCCRMPDLDQLKEMLTAVGFDIETVSADLDGILQGPSYLDPQGPLSEAWRAGDSTWSLTSDAELADAKQRVERMNAEGTMQAYLEERESKRFDIGQTTFVCGRK